MRSRDCGKPGVTGSGCSSGRFRFAGPRLKPTVFDWPATRITHRAIAAKLRFYDFTILRFYDFTILRFAICDLRGSELARWFYIRIDILVFSLRRRLSPT